MSTGLISNWAGNPQEIGAMYPFVGGEGFFFILLLIFWLGWMVWQLRSEKSEFAEDADALRKGDIKKEIRAGHVTLMDKDG